MSGLESLSDEQLAGRASAGDRAAFEVLVGRYTSKLQARIERSLRPGVRRKVAASDVLQDAYLAALRSLADFEDRGEGSFARWMTRIVAARIHDAVRHHVGASKRSVQREVTRPGRPATHAFRAVAPSPSQIAIGEEFREAVRGALGRLPESSREVVRLLQEERLGLDEAAERLGRTRSAVKRLYVRALAQLEELLELETRQRDGRRRSTL